jgi:hypothetical protein
MHSTNVFASRSSPMSRPGTPDLFESTTCIVPSSSKPTTVTLRPTSIIGSPSRGSVSSGANASTARHSSPNIVNCEDLLTFYSQNIKPVKPQ